MTYLNRLEDKNKIVYDKSPKYSLREVNIINSTLYFTCLLT